MACVPPPPAARRRRSAASGCCSVPAVALLGRGPADLDAGTSRCWVARCRSPPPPTSATWACRPSRRPRCSRSRSPRQTLAGRLRTVLRRSDGRRLAAAVQLDPGARAASSTPAATSPLDAVISLAYPVATSCVITIVVYTWLRRAVTATRQSPVSLPAGRHRPDRLRRRGLRLHLPDRPLRCYSSGSVIDLGWFLGFALILVAALAHPARARLASPTTSWPTRRSATCCPYTAVTVALLTSAVEVLRTGHADAFVVVDAHLIMVAARRAPGADAAGEPVADPAPRAAGARAHRRARTRAGQRFEALVQHSSDIVTVVDRRRRGYQSALHRADPRLPAAGAGRAPHLRPDGARARPATSWQALEHAAAEDMRIHTMLTTLAPRRRPAVPASRSRSRTCSTTRTSRGLVLNTRDVTDRVRLEEQLTEQAFTDSLTGLPNRALFKDRLQHALSRAGRRRRQPSAVMFLDLDGFKAVNDTLGHSTGDELLVLVAERLRALVAARRHRGPVRRRRVRRPARGLAADDDETCPGAAHQRRPPRAVRPRTTERVHVAASVGIARVDDHATHRGAGAAQRRPRDVPGQGGAAPAGSRCSTPRCTLGLVERRPSWRPTCASRRGREAVRRPLPADDVDAHRSDHRRRGAGALAAPRARAARPRRRSSRVAEATGLIRPIGSWVLREACRRRSAWSAGPGTPAA